MDLQQLTEQVAALSAEVAAFIRDEAGKLSLEVAGLKERLPVSRLYAGRFKAM